jgi:hypothetical protein
MKSKLVRVAIAALLALGPVMASAQTATMGVVDTVETVKSRWCAPEQKWCSPLESPRIVGTIEMVVRDNAGLLKERREIHNLVVDAGKAGVAGLINGVVTNFFEHIAIGTGVTAAAAGDTTCQTEITTNGGQRAAGTTSRVTTDTTNDTAQVVVTYNFTGSFAVTESCLLDSITTGTLLSRQVFSAVNVASGDSLQITWKLDVD